MRMLILFGLFCILNPFPNFLPAYNELKFVGIPILAGLVWIYNPPLITKRDVFLIALLAIYFISLLQANIIALSWHPFFTWSGIIFLAIGLRPFLKENEQWFLRMIYASFFLILIWVLYGIFFVVRSTDSGEWVKFVGQNINYAALMPLIYGAPLILKKFESRVADIFQVGLIAVLAFLSWYFQYALGVGMVMVLTGLFLFKYLPEKIIPYAIAGILAFSILGFALLWPQMNESFFDSTDIRWYRIKLSLIALLKNPMLGVGPGNWYFEVYQYMPLLGVERDVFGQTEFYMASHEFIFRLAAEVGIGGWICLAGAMSILFRYKAKLLPYWGTSLLLLMTFLSERMAESNEQTYNEVPLLLLLMYAMLTGEEKQSLKIRGIPVAMIVPALWAVFWFYSNHLFLRSIALEKEGKTKESIEKLEAIYHPIFRTVVGSEMLPIDWLLAQKYATLGEETKALEHYEACYQLAPYHVQSALDYAIYLKDRNPEKAKKIAAEIKAYRLSCEVCDGI